MFSNSLLMLGIIEDIDIRKIKHSNYNLRIPSIDGLYESIKEQGLLQPIIVKSRNEYFEIVAGNRRYEVCKKLGWKKIICHIVELSDKEAFEISLVENIQRKNLSPIEEARSFELYLVDRGWGGISELAQKIGKSISYVDRRLKLLELPNEVVESISKSLINPTIAEELITVRNKNVQSLLANLIIERKLSSRQTRSLIVSNNLNSDIETDAISNSISITDIDILTNRVFDKSITILKMAANKIGHLVPEIEENWIIYEILMQHKIALDRQIDLLIKQKKKL